MRVFKVIFFSLSLVTVSGFSQTPNNIKFERKIGNATISTNVSVPAPNIANKEILQGKTFNLDYKSKDSIIGKATLTSNKAIYKGTEYLVYVSPKGKLFIVYPNKDPKKGFNKKYITVE